MRQILFLSLSDSSSGTAPEFRACFDLSSCWTSASSTHSTSSYVDATSIPIIVTIILRQSLSDKESARVLEDRRLFVRWQKTWTDLSSILTTFSPTTNIFQNYCGCCFLAPPLLLPLLYHTNRHRQTHNWVSQIYQKSEFWYLSLNTGSYMLDEPPEQFSAL